ncbi:hypothetical protein ACX0HA_01685 [Flavobacterium hauense]
MDAATIEQWISVIEDNDFIIDKDKRIENLINLWKFASCYGNGSQITEDGLMDTAGRKNISVTFTDIDLKQAPKNNFINNIFSTIEPVLNDKHNGAYYIELNHQKNNFTSGSLMELEEEIINAIHGNLTPYNQVKKITKVNAAVGIYSNITAKDCNREDIAGVIEQTSSTANWLVLVLDRLVSHCDSFYIFDDVLLQPFKTEYEQLFLFDFYKGEIIQLATTK